MHDKQIFLVVEDSALSGLQYLNILVGSLHTPHVSYLYDCQLLSCARSSNSIAQVVDDAVRSLGIKTTLSVFYCLLLQNK